MLTMNGLTAMHASRQSYPAQYMTSYRSMSDLRSAAAAQQRSSWYDWPPSTGKTLTSRSSLVNGNTLSRSTNQLNHPTTFTTRQFRPAATPKTADFVKTPSYRHLAPTNGHAGRTTAVRQTETMTTTSRDGAARRRRQRPVDGSTGWPGPDDESVFSEPTTLQRRQGLYVPPPTDSRRMRAVSPEPAGIIDPELTRIGKAGDNYHVTMSLNAALQQQQPQPVPVPLQTMTSLRDVTSWSRVGDNGEDRSPLNGYSSLHTSRIDLTSSDLGSPPVGGLGYGAAGGLLLQQQPKDMTGTKTVIQIRSEGNAEKIATSPRSPSIRPVGRQSHERLDLSGYRIKSVKSMSDLRDIDSASMLASKRRRSARPGGRGAKYDSDDEKIEFDVELESSGRFPAQRSSATKYDQRRRFEQQKLLMQQQEKGNRKSVIDGNPPNYTMMMNDTMTMSYAPPNNSEQATKTEQRATAARNAGRYGPRSPCSELDDRQQRVPVGEATRRPPSANAGTQMSDTESRSKQSSVASAPAKLFARQPSAPRKLLAEQAIQVSEPISVSTQTNENRGTQTDKENRRPPPVDDFHGRDAVPPVASGRRPGGQPQSKKTGDNNADAIDCFRKALDMSDDNEHPGYDDSPEIVECLPVVESGNAGFDDVPDFGGRTSNRVSPDPMDVLRGAVNGNGDNRPVPSARKPPDVRNGNRTTERPATEYEFNNTLKVRPTGNAKTSPRRSPVDRTTGSSPFGYRPDGSGSAMGVNERVVLVKQLMKGAPAGSVTQREHREIEEEHIAGPLEGRLDEDGDPDALLNMDSVSEKVDLTLANGVAEMIVKVRCEHILPVRDTRDLFKKSSVIVTKIIEVNLMVTNERRQLYDDIIASQRQSVTGRLSNRDTFDLYQTFMEMASQDELAGRQAQQKVQIDRAVEEQRLLELHVNDDLGAGGRRRNRDAGFQRVDEQLNTVHSSADVDVRAQSSAMRRVVRN